MILPHPPLVTTTLSMHGGAVLPVSGTVGPCKRNCHTVNCGPWPTRPPKAKCYHPSHPHSHRNNLWRPLPCPILQPNCNPRTSLPTPGPPTHKSVRSQLASVGACRNITYPMHASPYQVPEIERGIAGRHRAATCRAARTLRRSAAQPVLPCVHGCDEAAVACMYQEAACHAGHGTTQEHHTCQAAACIGQ